MISQPNGIDGCCSETRDTANFEQKIGLPEYVNAEEHGFVILDITRDRVRAEYIYTESVKTRSAQCRGAATFEVRSGTNRVERIDRN